MRLGGPPRSPCRGPSPERRGKSPARVKISESPHPCPRSPGPSSPQPVAVSRVRDCSRPKRPDSPRCPDPPRLPWARASAACESRVRIRRLPPGPETLKSDPRCQAARSARRSCASPRAFPSPPRRAATEGGSPRESAAVPGEELPGQRASKMAAPMELFCWSGGWGLPSVDLDSLTVLVRGSADTLCGVPEAWGGVRGPGLANHPNFAREQGGKLRQPAALIPCAVASLGLYRNGKRPCRRVQGARCWPVLTYH